MKQFLTLALAVAITGCSSINITPAEEQAVITLAADNGAKALLSQQPQDLQYFVIADAALSTITTPGTPVTAVQVNAIVQTLDANGTDAALVGLGIQDALTLISAYVGSTTNSTLTDIEPYAAALDAGIKEAIAAAPSLPIPTVSTNAPAIAKLTLSPTVSWFKQGLNASK